MSASKVVDRLIAAWESLDAAAIAACFTEDGVWHNMPYPPVQGSANIAAAVSGFIAGMARAEFRLRHSGEIGPSVVVNERLDVFQTKAGKEIKIPVMGVFEIENDKIRVWRDYFDSGAMNG